MAFVQCEFYSETLGCARSLNAILPQRARLGPDDRSPVLYLLHGLSDNHTTWMRRTAIERYVRHLDVVVIMPSADRSFYTNMKQGYPYWDYIALELPEICAGLFPISSRREDTFAVGQSMGGYGAFKLALTFPERFAAAASLSGALDLVASWDERNDRLPEWRRIFGSPAELEGGPDDLAALARRLAARAPEERPRLLQCCGTEDFLYPGNKSFLAQARAAGLEVLYEEGPGGHDWAVWDANIERVLEWLPLRSF